MKIYQYLYLWRQIQIIRGSFRNAKFNYKGYKMEIKTVMKERIFSDEKMGKTFLFDTKNMYCDIYSFKPGQMRNPHTHKTQDKVYYILEGEAKFTISDEDKTVKKGEITIARTGERHIIKNESSNNVSMLVFMSPNPNH